MVASHATRIVSTDLAPCPTVYRLVIEHGEGNWSAIARCLNTMFSKSVDEGRIGKQCRERWNHHLRPDIRKDAWTEAEEQQLVSAHQT